VRTEKSAATPGALKGAAGYRFAIVFSRFNERITKRLCGGAQAALKEAEAHAGDVEIVSVPGAFELPQAARAIAETGTFDAVICLGCVIRGATPHFEYISSSVAHAIQVASAETGVPMAFGVLTTDTWEQAEERAGDGRDNKGFEAAAAAIEMAQLFRRWHPSRS
jgi:6,7-dimethyl-8-ribityllumazine synthase